MHPVTEVRLLLMYSILCLPQGEIPRWWHYFYQVFLVVHNTVHNPQKIIYFVKGYMLHTWFTLLQKKFFGRKLLKTGGIFCKIKYIFWYQITFVILNVRLRQKKSTRFLRETLGDVPSNLCQNYTRSFTLHVVGNIMT